MTAPAAAAAASARTLRIRQAIVIALLFGGYASLYFCRADLSVATPLLAKELARRGLSYDDALVRVGAITSLGILAYALGKPFVGGLGDYWGGRRCGDRGKVAGLATRRLEDYRGLLGPLAARGR